MHRFSGCLAVFVLVCGLYGSGTAFAGDEKSILISGASTGIGRHLAEALAEEGYHVYAGARKDEDLAELDATLHVRQGNGLFAFRDCGQRV